MWLNPSEGFADYEFGGQEFESLRARQQLVDFDSEFLRDFLPVVADTRTRQAEIASAMLASAPSLATAA